MPNPFRQIGLPGIRRSKFDLSHKIILTGDMGKLYPVLVEDCIPGDIMKIGVELLIRFNPLVAPLMHEVNAFVHYFFVPYRLLWTGDNGFEDFITGGEDGSLAPTFPTWTPTSKDVGSLWDYLGFPIDPSTGTGIVPTGLLPSDMPRRAYNMIYNEYYRQQEIITEVALTNEDILYRAWGKDYFSTAQERQQRGTAPALPISGTTSAIWAGDVSLTWPAYDGSSPVNMQTHSTNYKPANGVTENALELGKAPKTGLDANTVDLSTATTFDIADLRLAFQVQKWLERQQRGGARYVETLGAHYIVHPRDDRLQRPEYIGGSRQPVIFSEVLQTSKTETGAPQGNLAGHGISVNRAFAAKYRVLEHGLIMGILSVMPKPSYCSQGVDRQWIKTTKYDFPWPEFVNLSEQPVLRGEIYANGVTGDNNTVFGYQGRHNEYRYRPDKVMGLMRTDFNFYHCARIFASAPALNDTFLNCNPSKRNFAVTDTDTLMISIGNLISAIRPLPIIPVPGFIDH